MKGHINQESVTEFISLGINEYFYEEEDGSVSF